MVIPKEYNGKPVVEIAARAFMDCDELESASVPTSVTTIGAEIFSGCCSLKSLVLPFIGKTAETEIGGIRYPLGYVFSKIPQDGFERKNQYNTKINADSAESTLAVYFFPSSLRSVKVLCGTDVYGDFSGCDMLTEVELPETVKVLHKNSFYQCENISEIKLPKSLTEIGAFAFLGCRKLKRVVIPDNVRSLGMSAFSDCSLLKDLKIGSSVERIEEKCFYLCNNLLSVTIPSSVTQIGTDAFYCLKLMMITNLSEAELSGQITAWADIRRSESESFAGTLITDKNGVQIYTRDNEISLMGYEGSSSVLDLSRYSINRVFSAALYCNDYVRKIIFPKSLHFLGSNYCFAFCSALESVDFSDNEILSHITYGAFASCERLTDIKIPDSVTVISSNAFSDCSSLTSFELPEKLETIYNASFRGCALTSVTIPQNVTMIEENPFVDCYKLESLFVKAGNTTYQAVDNCIIDKDKKTLVIGCKASIIPSDGQVTVIGKRAFGGMSELTNIEIPDAVTLISSDAFRNCDKLTRVGFGDESLLNEIGNNAFFKCSELADIEIPESVTVIGFSVFIECESLTSINLPESITEIGSHTFHGTGLTSIVIPSKVTVLSDGMFMGCDDLTVVVIPASVKTVGRYAFSYCFSLREVTIFSGVEEIGDNAFDSSLALQIINIPVTVTKMGGNVFTNCNFAVIYCAAEEKPEGWNQSWAGDGTVVWGAD